jgi:anti-sigma regulatory factor (Ser/Thr protein kinase)
MTVEMHKQLELLPRTSVVADARHAVKDWCGGWCLTHLADAVELLVSELVTNAVVHGLGAVRVLADYDGTRLRVEVHDHHPIPPRPHVTAGPDLDEHGRGLQLVAMLADSWGSTRTFDGKVVWIELTAAGPAPLHT